MMAKRDNGKRIRYPFFCDAGHSPVTDMLGLLYGASVEENAEPSMRKSTEDVSHHRQENDAVG